MPADQSKPVTSPVVSSATPHEIDWRQACTLILVQIFLLGMILSAALDIEGRDLRVPVSGVHGDAVYVLSNVTAIIDTGWYWFNPRLSAPYTLDLRPFPANSSVDYALVWLTTRFTKTPGLALNLAWLLMILLSGVIALGCMLKVGAHPIAALAFSTLYALLPPVFYRATHHFMMSFYLVPLGCVLALLLATAELDAMGVRFRRFLVAGCVLMGFNYIYNAYFCGFLLAAGTFIGVIRSGNMKVLKLGALTLCLLSAATLVNLSPALYSWHNNGKPYEEFKTPADSETFGLKIRHLLSPQTPHGFPPLASWLAKERDAGFPIENENSSARLGVVGSVGFILLLIGLMVPNRLAGSPRGRYLVGLAQLNLSALLLSTVGGFGSLISLLMLSQIRCYNRIVVFIGFFALSGLALAASEAMRLVRPQTRAFVALCSGIAIMAAFGVYDQQYAAANLRLGAPSDQRMSGVLEDVVKRMEGVLKPGSLVYELPETTFPPDSVRNGMQPYDQGRPHIYSASLRWSWPDFSPLRHAWGRGAQEMTADALPSYLCLSGFDAVWLDKAGYASPQASPEAELRKRCGAPLVTSTDGRYVVFDLRSIRDAMMKQVSPSEYESRRSAILAPVVFDWGNGFYPPERNASTGDVFRWSRESSNLTLTNVSDRERRLTLKCLVQAGHAEGADLLIRGTGVEQKFQISAVARELSVPLRLDPKQRLVLSFRHTGSPLVVAGDPRSLSFILIGVRLVE